MEIFVGLRNMLLKGITSPKLTNDTFRLLLRLIPLTRCACVDGPKSSELLTVYAFFLHLCTNFLLHERDDFCVTAAEKIADVLKQLGGHHLLVKNFKLYANKTYSKLKENWVNDICKYLVLLHVPPYTLVIFSFLVDVLESGDIVYSDAVVKILSTLLNYIDFQNVALYGSELTTVVLRLFKHNLWDSSLYPIHFDNRSSTQPEKLLSDKDTEPVCFKLPKSSWYCPERSLATMHDRFGKLLRACGRELHNHVQVVFSNISVVASEVIEVALQATENLNTTDSHAISAFSAFSVSSMSANIRNTSSSFLTISDDVGGSLTPFQNSVQVHISENSLIENEAGEQRAPLLQHLKNNNSFETKEGLLDELVYSQTVSDIYSNIVFFTFIIDVLLFICLKIVLPLSYFR